MNKVTMPKGCVIWLTGLPCSGKTTAARALEKALRADRFPVFVLDGDVVRKGLCRDLGFSDQDRRENVRRIAEVARLFADHGVICVAALISPFRAAREQAMQIVGADRFLEIHVATELSVCEQRDDRSLYAKARAGEIPEFTGISSPYEPPEQPDLRLDAAVTPPDQAARMLVNLLRRRGFIPTKKKDEKRD